MSFRAWRIAVLLFVLVLVAASTWLTRRRLVQWDRVLVVSVHPVIAEPEIAPWVLQLDDEAFAPVRAFFQNRVDVRLGKTLTKLPPERPGEDATWLDIAWFSLRLRAWSALRRLPRADVRIYVRFYRWEPSRLLEHSGSLPNAQLGVVYAFASDTTLGQTQIAIAHELLHTLGATDKYAADGSPGDTAKLNVAEIMAGSLALPNHTWRPAESLAECEMGPVTKAEIAW